MLQAVVNNSIFSIFWVIWKAKELVFVLAIFVFHRGWYRGDIWQASLWAPRLLLLLRCGKLIKQEKILWVTLDTVNNGNERQSRLQEYADNVLESCLGKISGSNLSEGMTKHDWHYLSRARSVSGPFMSPTILQLRCLEDDALTTSRASLWMIFQALIEGWLP